MTKDHEMRLSDDVTVPVVHLDLYAKAIPQARSRRLPGRDHQFHNELGELAADLRRQSASL